jgi:hypothetical protein
MATGTTQLDAEDFQSLNRFEVYAALMANSSVQPWCSLRTEPPAKPTTDPAAVRKASRDCYGRDRIDIDAELQRLVTGSRLGSSAGTQSGIDDLSPRKRSAGGGS